MIAQHWDLILITLALSALILRRSKIVLAVVALSAPIALIASSESISLAIRAVGVGFIYLIMTWIVHMVVRQKSSEAGQYIQWIAFSCAVISFIKLFVWGSIPDVTIHDKIQGQLDGIMLFATTLLVSCLFLKDKPVGLHELVRDILNGVAWIRNLPNLLRNGQRKA